MPLTFTDLIPENENLINDTVLRNIAIRWFWNGLSHHAHENKLTYTEKMRIMTENFHLSVKAFEKILGFTKKTTLHKSMVISE